jgi:hypothetical protein
LGVQVVEYDPEGDGIPSDLSMYLDIGATTRAGIDYEWNPPQYGFSWVNVSTPIQMPGDNSYALFNLDYPVLYYGINYSSLYVFSNGFVSFTSPDYASTPPSSLPNSSMPDAIVAPFWRELNLSQGGSILTGCINYTWPGDGYWGCYQVFTWNGIPDQNGDPQTFQLLLGYRSLGGDGLAYQSNIFFQYLSITNDVATTIGVQDRIGQHGSSYPLSDISNGTAGGLNAVAYGIGYRLEELEFTIAKQGDSNAMLQPLCADEEGANVELNTTGQNNYGSLWGTVIEAGAQQLLDLTDVGEVFDALFLIYDISGSAVGSQYQPASGQISYAGLNDNESTGSVPTHDLSGGVDGSYVGLPFDASFGDGFLWQFQDNYTQDHTINITATAVYAGLYGAGGKVSTSVVLTMYTGSHYLDIGSNVGGETVSAPVAGFPVWVDGQQYSTPVSGLVVTQGVHNITAASTVYANGVPRYSFSEWSGGELNNSLPTEDIEADWSQNADYVIIGDINLDGTVNILDAIILAAAFGSKPGQSNWNSAADLNGDGTVNILDAILLGANFGISYNSSYTGSLSGASGQTQSAKPMTQGGASVLVDPSQITVFEGENLTANVDVTGVTDLYGWEFQLYWNSTVLNCTNAAVVTPPVWQGYQQDYGPGLQPNYNSTCGMFSEAEAAEYPAPPFNGSTTVATLTFQALQPGTTSLTLADALLGDSTAQPISCTVSSGSVTVYMYATLSISVSGAGTTSPAPGNYSYSYGTNVTVTATPSSGYAFSYWSLDGTDYYGNPITVTMTANNALTAHFVYVQGGCVLYNTSITMADGKTVPVQTVKLGDQIIGYDVQTGTFVTETVTSNNCTTVDEVLSINNGLLYVTPTDQPIYTDHGWVINPQDIMIGWKIYNPTTNTWITVQSVRILEGNFRVYDLQATQPNTFIGNGILLDRKT